ncbi:hypothetical protein BT69DRAFT_1278178 [Atractiella rhizophila]|nr:hypothetical protein BT69DRAFT_1278178 [Atractiella rhizophila]
MCKPQSQPNGQTSRDPPSYEEIPTCTTPLLSPKERAPYQNEADKKAVHVVINGEVYRVPKDGKFKRGNVINL